MRALVLGGTGIVGQAVARTLVKFDEVKQVVIGCRTADRSRLHEKLRQNEKVAMRELDIYDHTSLVNAMKDVNIVIHCVGPFFRTGATVAKAAIETKTNYVDICDDYEVVNFLFTPEIDEAAREAGITILTGMGSDPGTNNLVAKYYAEKLDSVDEIALYWVISLADLGDRGTWGAAWDHSLYMNIGNIPQFIDGKISYVPAGSGEEEVEFPEPLGKCKLHYVGHPQPLTLPKHIEGVKTVTIRGGFLPEWVDQLIKNQKEEGLLDLEPVEVKGKKVSPYDIALELWKRIPEGRDRGPAASGTKVKVTGEKDGKRVTYSCVMVGRTAPGTGIPASVAALMIHSGKVKTKGVVPPEACINPKEFLNIFVGMGAKIYHTEKVESLLRP